MKEMFGDAVVADLARACEEREEYNASGGYTVSYPWVEEDLGKGRKATVGEVIQFLRGLLRAVADEAKRRGEASEQARARAQRNAAAAKQLEGRVAQLEELLQQARTSSQGASKRRAGEGAAGAGPEAEPGISKRVTRRRQA